ncbi:hypothetical protein FIBSPDRAFT_968588, partial [Athelia psychrophila]
AFRSSAACYIFGVDHYYLQDLIGTVYAVITTNGTASADANTVAGVAVLEFEFDSAGKLLV